MVFERSSRHQSLWDSWLFRDDFQLCLITWQSSVRTCSALYFHESFVMSSSSHESSVRTCSALYFHESSVMSSSSHESSMRTCRSLYFHETSVMSSSSHESSMRTCNSLYFHESSVMSSSSHEEWLPALSTPVCDQSPDTECIVLQLCYHSVQWLLNRCIQVRTAHCVVSPPFMTHTTRALVVRRTTRPKQRSPVYSWTNTACRRLCTLLQVFTVSSLWLAA